MSAISYLKEKVNSGYLEKIAEYAFSKDLLASAAFRHKYVLIVRSDYNVFGHDIIVQNKESRKVMILQLKVSVGKVYVWDIHKTLLSSRSGQVVLIKVEEKEGSLRFNYFIFDKERTLTALQRPPKKAHPDKCKTRKSDYIYVPLDELYDKILEE